MATTTNGTKKTRTPVDALKPAELELRAMKKIGAALEGLSAPARARALDWASEHYGIGSQVVHDLGPGHERVGG